MNARLEIACLALICLDLQLVEVPRQWRRGKYVTIWMQRCDAEMQLRCKAENQDPDLLSSSPTTFSAALMKVHLPCDASLCGVYQPGQVG